MDGVSLKASEANDFFKWTSFTTVCRQSNAITADQSFGKYAQVNKTVIYVFRFRAGGAGTAGNRIEIDLPVTAASSSVRVIGSALFNDQSASDWITCNAVQFSTTRLAFLTNTGTSLTSYLGTTNGPAITVAINDFLGGVVSYEAA